MIYVVKPSMPPLEEYQAMLAKVWERQWLTNHGPLLREFEAELPTYLGAGAFHFVASGTVALQVALKTMDVAGEVITSPFSFVATTNAILAEKCTPVFVDIDPQTFNVDPTQIEQAIGTKTSAILVPHIFGQACDIEAILEISQAHELKVIFDGAQCFGTKYQGRSVFDYGDVSTISFHATKLFHTCEGGGVFATQPEALDRLRKYSNFGFDSHPERFACAGINGKNSELHAAMGLCMLKYADELLAQRKQQWLRYKRALGADYQVLQVESPDDYNYAYFPILFPDEEELKIKLVRLSDRDIKVRRYFYPALSTLSYVENQVLPVVDSIAPRIICLPLYHDLSEEEQGRVIETLME